MIDAGTAEAGQGQPSGTHSAHASTSGKPGHQPSHAPRVPNALSCSGEQAPEPQFSPSNQTIHWGYKVICNSATSISIIDTLYVVEGTGDNEHNVEQGEVTNSGVAPNLVVGTFHACGGSVRTRWITESWAKANNSPVNPYPAWSPVNTLTCGPWQ